MHGFVFKQIVDLLQFLFLERPKNNTWGRRGAPTVDNDSTAGHSGAGVWADITVDDDQPVFHPTADSGACSAPNEEVPAGHFRTGIVAASVKHRDAASCHSVPHKIASHAFTDNSGAEISGTEEAASISLERERTTAAKGCHPRAQHPERSKPGALR